MKIEEMANPAYSVILTNCKSPMADDILSRCYNDSYHVFDAKGIGSITLQYEEKYIAELQKALPEQDGPRNAIVIVRDPTLPPEELKIFHGTMVISNVGRKHEWFGSCQLVEFKGKILTSADENYDRIYDRTVALVKKRMEFDSMLAQFTGDVQAAKENAE